MASCAPKPEEEIVQPNDDQEEQEISIATSHQLSDQYYRMLLPFRPSKARGFINNQIGNRLDINEVEDGLRRHSTSVFDPDTYYFEDGQYLTQNMVINMIEEYNPEREDKYQSEEKHRKNPRYLSHIVEQNFLEKKSDNTGELSGISIGIALKSVYRFQTEIGGPYYYEKIEDKEIIKQGKEIAQKVLEQVRQIEGLQEVPVMMALYREEEFSSPVPGNFFAKTFVEKNDMLIKDWETIDEEYVLFPSEQARKEYADDYEILKDFGEAIDQYFPNYVGYIGEGFYVNEKLKKLTIEIPIEFYGESEVVGFTQYMYGIVQNTFSNYYDLEIKVKSDNRIESFIYQEANSDKPFIHIFH